MTKPEMDALLAGFGDHERFCLESLRIRDLGGSAVTMVLSPGQLKLHRAIMKQRRAGKPVRIVALKTRRSWFTAACCAEMFHSIPFFPGRKGLVIADKYNPAAMEAFGYLLQFQKSYKSFGGKLKLPRLVKDSEQKLEWANGSAIDVLSAEGGEVGRGGGRHFLLGDELAFWRAPEVTLTAIMNMLPKLPDTEAIFPSTANGVGGEFYDLCQRAQDPAQKGLWEFLFFGWLEHPIYRLKLDEVKAPEFQASLNDEEKLLQSMHGATLEQLHWRRVTIATECRGKVDLFHQEYPTTPEEAFLSSGRPALDTKALARMPVSNGTSGEIQVVEEFPRKKMRFVARDHGALTIWKKPEPGHAYIVGADPSKGVDVSEAKRGDDPDYSVGFVIDQHTGEQVAMLRERLRPVPFAEYLALLGEVYNHAFIVPEANDAGFIDALLRTNYPLGMIFNRRRDPTDRRSAQPEEIGFETTNVTRPWLVSALDDAVREMSITIRSPIALQECRTFVIKPTGKAEHQTGCHDDCVIAAALAVMGLRYAPKKRVTTVEREMDRRRPMVPYGQPRKQEDD